MPLINGIKMACEPCIRGHRSTKCTHANERLMVPVKKPGRPLSSCPHLHDQLCGCSSITAAIPRKSTCGCGSANHSSTPSEVRPLPSAIPDVPSPTKVAFKVQKSSSRPSSRKYNFHPDNLPRMDPGNISIAPLQPPKKPQVIAPAIPNGAPLPPPHNSYQNGFSNGSHHGLPTSLNGSLANGFPPLTNGAAYTQPNAVSNGAYGPVPPLRNGSIPFNEMYTNPTIASVVHGQSTPSRKSSAGDCCSNAEVPPLSHQPSISSEDSLNGSGLEQYPFPSNYSSHQNGYPNFLPQTTVYAYPASYGSYEKPLLPAEWRQSVLSNMYAQQPLPSDRVDDLNQLSAYSTPPDNSPFIVDTLHSCGCGDSCQCIGCAAHPYNDATQEYIKSALKVQESTTTTPTTVEFDPAAALKFSPLISGEAPAANLSNGTTTSDGPPDKTADTPSDSTAEEQSYTADDFFFVSYPFSGDGCGGETASCPCGDDCECLGCTIHRNYSVSLDESIAEQMTSNGNKIENSNGHRNGNGIKVEDEVENGTSSKAVNGIDGYGNEIQPPPVMAVPASPPPSPPLSRQTTAAPAVLRKSCCSA